MTRGTSFPRGRVRWTRALALAVPLAFLAATILGPATSASGVPTSAAGSSRLLSGASLPSVGATAVPGCDRSSVAAVELSSGTLNALPLTDQVVRADARDGCGTLLSDVQFQWSLVPADLGGLNSTTGPSVVYSSCYVPMSGTLSVTATHLGQSRTNFTFVTVGPPTSSSPSAPAGGPALSGSPRALEGALALVFGVLGVAVVAWAVRDGRRSSSR